MTLNTYTLSIHTIYSNILSNFFIWFGELGPETFLNSGPGFGKGHSLNPLQGLIKTIIFESKTVIGPLIISRRKWGGDKMSAEREESSSHFPSHLTGWLVLNTFVRSLKFLFPPLMRI